MEKQKLLNFKDLNLDQIFHAILARSGGWLSPTALILAYSDWIMHLGYSPERLSGILRENMQCFIKFIEYAIQKSIIRRCCHSCRSNS